MLRKPTELGIVSGEMDQDSSAQAEDEHPHMQLLQNNHCTLTLEKNQFVHIFNIQVLLSTPSAPLPK